MATPKEINKESAERLFDLLVIEKLNAGKEVAGLATAIARARASMSEEIIAWVEKQVAAS